MSYLPSVPRPNLRILRTRRLRVGRRAKNAGEWEVRPDARAEEAPTPEERSATRLSGREEPDGEAIPDVRSSQEEGSPSLSAPTPGPALVSGRLTPQSSALTAPTPGRSPGLKELPPLKGSSTAPRRAAGAPPLEPQPALLILGQ